MNPLNDILKKIQLRDNNSKFILPDWWTTSLHSNQTAFENCPIVQAVIRKISSCFSVGKINGIEKDDWNFFNLEQTNIEFLNQLIINLLIEGGVYIVREFGIRVGRMEYRIYRVLDVEPKFSSDLLSPVSFEVSSNLNNYMITKSVSPEDVIYISDMYASSSNQYKAISRLQSLQYDIENIILVQEVLFALNENRGMLGYVTNETVIGGSTLPMQPEEHNKITEFIRNMFGLQRQKDKIAVSPVPLKWVPISPKVSDMMLFEGIQQNIQNIASVYQVPMILLNAGTSSYSNLLESKRSFYQDFIIPLSIVIFEKISIFMGTKVGMDYSDIECFTDARYIDSKTLRLVSASVKLLADSGMITREEIQGLLQYYKLLR